MAKPLSQEEYESLRDVALKIAERFPADQFYIVGFGRSPDPVLAILNELDSNYVKSIPFNSTVPELTSGLELVDRDGELGFGQSEYDPEKHDKALDYMSRHLPTDNEINGRTVLALDFASSGLTMAYASALLERVRQGGGSYPKRNWNHLALAITNAEGYSAAKKIYDQGGLTLHYLDPGEVVFERFDNREFRHFSKYESLTPEGFSSPEPLEELPEYRSHVAELRTHMGSDPNILRSAISPSCRLSILGKNGKKAPVYFPHPTANLK